LSYQVNFLDNQNITAEGLNAVSESLGGVSPDFQNGTVYGVDALNRITESLVQKGVSVGCGLSVVDSQVMIGAGVLFMSDGKRVEIDAEGVLLPFTLGAVNYVWFYQDTALGIVVPKCTETEPAGDDFVVLGEITETGMISGYADLAVMKNTNLGLNHSETYSVTVSFDNTATEETLIHEIPLAYVGCGRVIVSSETESELTNRHNFFCGYVDLTTGKSFGVQGTTPETVSTYLWGTVSTSESGGTLQTAFACNSGNHYNVTMRFTLESDNVLRIYRTSALSSISDGYTLPEVQKLTLTIC